MTTAISGDENFRQFLTVMLRGASTSEPLCSLASMTSLSSKVLQSPSINTRLMGQSYLIQTILPMRHLCLLIITHKSSFFKKINTSLIHQKYLQQKSLANQKIGNSISKNDMQFNVVSSVLVTAALSEQVRRPASSGGMVVNGLYNTHTPSLALYVSGKQPSPPLSGAKL